MVMERSNSNASGPRKDPAERAHVALIELRGVCYSPVADEESTGVDEIRELGVPCRCQLHIQSGNSSVRILEGHGETQRDALMAAINQLCAKNCRIAVADAQSRHDGSQKWTVAIEQAGQGGARQGVGRAVARDTGFALAAAALRAVNHANLLKPEYRANNQRTLRRTAHHLLGELSEALGLGSLGELKHKEAESIILEHLNRVASAAVITAANHPSPASVLGLFDTSAWLYDRDGKRRDSFTDTDHWLAWYPGLENDKLTVQQALDSLPAAPDSEIPWIVKLFENPESWLRFRGAISLDDHDVLHVLLGRGLQDQDEAFVLGFAMGTAKRVNWLESYLFKWVLTGLYPEPYRIPRFLLPAFDLGVRCGQETGAKNLYRQPLSKLKAMTLAQARAECQIEVGMLREFYRREQSAIPFTIASLRLPAC